MMKINSSKSIVIQESKFDKERKEQVLILYGSKRICVMKKRLINLLNHENAIRYASMWNTIKECYHREFLGLSNFILENIHNVNMIQIYQNGVVRLYLNGEQYESKKNIFYKKSLTEEENSLLLSLFK